VLHNASALLLPLSKALQSSKIDLIAALSSVDEVDTVIHSWRLNNKHFSSLFTDAAKLSEGCGGDPSLLPPRRAPCQRHRHNVNAENSEDYWRITIYVPYLDHLLSEVNNRFADVRSTVASLSLLHLASPTAYPLRGQCSQFVANLRRRFELSCQRRFPFGN
jgi:hypothetical protein